jgi:hypothetical protein
VEQEEAAVTKQQHGKHVSTATDSDVTTEDTVFSVRSMRRSSKDQQQQQFSQS